MIVIMTPYHPSEVEYLQNIELAGKAQSDRRWNVGWWASRSKVGPAAQGYRLHKLSNSVDIWYGGRSLLHGPRYIPFFSNWQLSWDIRADLLHNTSNYCHPSSNTEIVLVSNQLATYNALFSERRKVLSCTRVSADANPPTRMHTGKVTCLLSCWSSSVHTEHIPKFT